MQSNPVRACGVSLLSVTRLTSVKRAKIYVHILCDMEGRIAKAMGAIFGRDYGVRKTSPQDRPSLSHQLSKTKPQEIIPRGLSSEEALEAAIAIVSDPNHPQHVSAKAEALRRAERPIELGNYLMQGNKPERDVITGAPLVGGKR